MTVPTPVARTWMSRHTAGRVMIAVAVFGVVVALVGTVVAWQFVGQLSRSADRSLVIGEDALVTLDATLDVAEDVLGSVDEGLGGVVSTLTVVGDVVDDTSAVSTATVELAGEIAPSIDRIDDALASLQSVTSTIDTVLRQLSQVPFGPSYDPETSFDQAIADVRADLTPIGDSLRDAADELGTFSDGSGELTAELSALAADVEEVRRSLAGSESLLESYRTTSSEALLLAQETRSDLDADLGRTRLLIVLLGLALAAGQIVPAWIGRELTLAPLPGTTTTTVTTETTELSA